MPRNTILLRGNAREESRIVETEVARPGMLVELRSGGKCRPQTVSGGQLAPIFVREQHENEGNGVDDTVAIGDEATLLFPELGAKINAYTADTIAEGDTVTPDGNGGVRLADSGDYVIGVASAASDLSGSVGRCEIIVAPLGVSA